MLQNIKMMAYRLNSICRCVLLPKCKIQQLESISPHILLARSKTTFVDTEIWRPVYQFNLIRIAAATNKLKIYQGAVAALGIPLSWSLEHAGNIPDGVTEVVSAIGISGLLTLLFVGKLTSNLIGFLYTNGSDDKIKISYVDFWGKRKNMIAPISDIIPISELPARRQNLYVPLKFYTRNEKFKLLPTFGLIHDFRTFEAIFGDNNQ